MYPVGHGIKSRGRSRVKVAGRAQEDVGVVRGLGKARIG